jgi:translation initiation factor 4E
MTASDSSYPAPADSGTYEAGLTTVGDFDTVESYCRYFNWLKPPSKLDRNSNYHLFKSGIKPMWEDEANANGGKWVLTMKNNPTLLDQCWQWLTMALVGEELDESDEICGAVVSLRSKVDRIQLWTRSKDDVEKVNSIGRKLVKLLDVSEADSIGLEFQVSSLLTPLSLPRVLTTSHVSTTRRIVPSRTSSSLFRPSPSLPSGPHSTSQAVLSLVPAKALAPAPVPPAQAQAAHSQVSGSTGAVCSAPLLVAGAQSALARAHPNHSY